MGEHLLYLVVSGEQIYQRLLPQLGKKQALEGGGGDWLLSPAVSLGDPAAERSSECTQRHTSKRSSMHLCSELNGTL